MLSEFDSLSTRPRQAVNVFDSTGHVARTVADAAYSDIRFSQFAFDDSQWIAMSQLDTVETDIMITDVNPTTMIEKAWRQGLEITDLAYGQGEWLLYGQEDSGVEQVLAHTTDFNKIPVLIWERWAEGYIVTEVCHGKGAWAIVFSRPTREDHPLHGLVQVYSTISGDFDEVQEKVEYRWSQDFAITNIASNGTLWVIIGTKFPGIVSQQIILAEGREELLEVMYKGRQSGLTVTELLAVP